MASFLAREPDVVVKGSRLGSFTDCLVGKYTSSSSSGAKLISLAAGLVMKEAVVQAQKAASNAVTACRDSDDKAALADSLRLAVHVLCCTGKADEGITMAKDELWRFRDAADKTSEAKMTLSLAQAHCAMGTADGVEQALQEVQEALRLFRGQGDKLMVASAQLTSAAVFLEKRGDMKKRADEAKQAVEEAIPIFRELGETAAEAYAMHLMGCSRALSGTTEGALRAAKEAQALYVKAELKKQAAFELHQAAVWHLKDGDVDDAVAAAREAMDIFEDDLKATNGEAAVVQTLVQAYLTKKEFKEAMKLAKYELDRFAESGNGKGQAACQEMVMLCYVGMNNTGRAMRYAQRAADTLEEMGDRKGQGKLLRTMSTLHRANDEHDHALRAAQEALTIFEDLEDTKEQAVTLQARADVYLQKKEQSRALALASEARELYSDAKHVEGEVSALLQLSAAQFAEGDFKKAAASAREAQDKATEVQDQAGEASALKALMEVHVMEKEFDAALRVLGSLLTLVKETGDREEEVNVMIYTCRTLIMQITQKEEEGKSNEKMYKATADKATKMAKDALGVARKLDSPMTLGTALFTVGQTAMMNGKVPDAMKAADEALKVFGGNGIAQGEAATLALQADIALFSRDIGKARELGEEAVFLFQQIGDAEGEDMAWTELERVERVEAEIYEEQMKQEQMRQQFQMQQWAMQSGQMPMPQEEAPAEEAAASAAAGGGYEAKLMKLDIGAGLDPAVLKGQIMEVTKGLIGYDEDIEYDNPLMESGLTSNTAVLLRDSLTQQLPGVNLPVTLVFDYPSIQAMSELIMENAAKAAKKAARAAIK
mmetsp:Transcript_65924/g.204054  ORF Transcript_65924/g.204054 Transcript_65924/m.204054 type:complete len:829 (-) Transcript_65924:89-2575(-)